MSDEIYGITGDRFKGWTFRYGDMYYRDCHFRNTKIDLDNGGWISFDDKGEWSSLTPVNEFISKDEMSLS
jgi:hypothetical protein